ncbi:hypothetical protein CUJ83_03495 [Methanocella sp. CWC-04]|uniref:Uncharacterized protein n=1 Tax=Methanooceanicella nereidis TaxID=2052831 RepID=A0AAP2W6A2_9EURY|nr:hypothetical protein [Methanocella sp. CWC-04]MCD1294059.1 hypothetical protein [Methanocella sp. CWC-04]
MEKTIKLSFAVLIALILLNAGCMASAYEASPASSADIVKPLVKNFVTYDETFKYDGIRETLAIEQLNDDTDKMGLLQADIPGPAYKYKVKFDCLHTGYGDRRGKYLGQAITGHEAIITVENYRIKSAIMDEYWDMMNEEVLFD